MFKFLATTQNTRKSDQKNRTIIAGKTSKKRSVNLLFASLPYKLNESRAVVTFDQNGQNCRLDGFKILAANLPN